MSAEGRAGLALGEGAGRAPDAAPTPEAPGDGALRSIARAHFDRSCAASDRFFEERADDVSRACWEMAKRFHRGGRLLVVAGPGPGTSDAYHVSVEFVHPVLVGKRALPALALGSVPARRVRQIGRPQDILLAISAAGDDAGVLEALGAARERGLLTVGLAGGGAEEMARREPDHLFALDADDPLVVQEVHETVYHVLWELVHVFFDHGELL